MDKAGKHEARKQLEEIFDNAGAVVVTHYSGLSVAEMTGLRAKLREGGGQLKVIKNRVAKKALEAVGDGVGSDLFTGPVAIAFAEDPTVPAKATTEYAKENEKLKLVGGIMDGDVLDVAGVGALASLPSREELIAGVVQRLLGQASQIGQRLAAPGSNLAGAITAIGEQASS